MPRLFLILLQVLLLAWPMVIGAFDAQTNAAGTDPDDQEEDIKNIAKVQEEAALYRLAKDSFVSSPDYDARAAEFLRQARVLLETGQKQSLEGWYYGLFSDHRRARWLAMDGFKDCPYSAAAGDLLATAIEAFSRSGDIAGIYRHLVMLWYYLPDYPHLQAVMESAQAAGERAQNFESAINLEAENPADVIRVDGDSMLGEVIRLYRFHALHGDRETVAPRAALGMARGLMHIKSSRDIWIARREYERFLDAYPSHPLTFNALCEQALCYLITYQGKDYDVGVLSSAAAVINQAEVEARGDLGKLRKVEAYRKRIRSWHQDRDLAVARWYADRIPPWLAIIMRPGEGPDAWNRGARSYYRAVAKRDSTSTQGRAAALELDRMPPEPPDVLTLPPIRK